MLDFTAQKIQTKSNPSNAGTKHLGLLVTALLFGGMILYSVGFAAFVFSTLPPELAGNTLRLPFPYFYLFVLTAATVAAVVI